MALPAIGSTASATATTLYVNKAVGANCTDSGTGTQAAPFCSVVAAAAAVLPGQTVEIAGGEYNEDLVITRSGKADAPIVFRGTTSTHIGGWNNPSKGITVKGAEYVEFADLSVASEFLKPVVVVDGSRHVKFTHLSVGGGSGVHITNGSQQVTYARGIFGTIQGPVFKVDGGSTGTVLTTNHVAGNYADEMTGVLVSDAPGTVVVSNTVDSRCFPGIVVSGASGGAVIKNNVVNTANYPDKPCATPARATGITVAQSATAGTEVDYNVVESRSSGAAYNWAGTDHTSQASFTAASGQGGHDFVGKIWEPAGPDKQISPLVDSADESAPGMLPVDVVGTPAANHPAVPNTGTGSGTRDRGAHETLDFGSAFTSAGPSRLLDTRVGVGVPVAQAVAPFGTVDLQVAGVAGVPVSGVTAVTMNVTVTDPAADGHLVVYPHGGDRPTASNLNWVAGRTVPNLVTVPVTDGKVSFYNASGGTVQVIADLAGYYGPQGRYTYEPVGPWRVADTRQDQWGSRPAGTVPARGTLDIPFEIPGDVATLNVTVTEPGTAGHLVVYPYGETRPNASNLNFQRGDTIANQVVVGMKDGKVSVHNASDAPVHIVVDLFGFYRL